MKTILTLLSVLVLLLFGCAVLKPYPVNFGARQVFIPADQAEGKAKVSSFAGEALPFRVETWQVRVKDGAALGALYLRRNQPKGLLVYFQGGAARRGARSMWRLQRFGMSRSMC